VYCNTNIKEKYLHEKVIVFFWGGGAPENWRAQIIFNFFALKNDPTFCSIFLH